MNTLHEITTALQAELSTLDLDDAWNWAAVPPGDTPATVTHGDNDLGAGSLENMRATVEAQLSERPLNALVMRIKIGPDFHHFTLKHGQDGPQVTPLDVLATRAAACQVMAAELLYAVQTLLLKAGKFQEPPSPFRQ